METNNDAGEGRPDADCSAWVGYCPRCDHFEPDYEIHRQCPDCGNEWAGACPPLRIAHKLFEKIGAMRHENMLLKTRMREDYEKALEWFIAAQELCGACDNLIAAKGRHNSRIAYEKLVEAVKKFRQPNAKHTHPQTDEE